MATLFEEFNEYRCIQYNEDAPRGQTAIIQCYMDDKPVGSIIFYRDGIIIPPSDPTGLGIIGLSMRESRFNNVISTIREEKPLFIGINDVNNWGGITTSKDEPIGEEES
jgi:hypothetical protein